MIPHARGRHTGVVADYDDPAGFGEIVVEPAGSGGRAEPAGSGGRAEPAGQAGRFWFHCTALVDGSRHAEPGQQVTFRLVPGHCGRWEATEIT